MSRDREGESARPTERWLLPGLRIRTSVRTFVVVVLFSGLLVAIVIRGARVQADAVAAIRREGGTVFYEWEHKQPTLNAKGEPPAPRWLINLVGVDLFGGVIARSFEARVFHFTWIDDFAAARNAALPKATGDYVFWLDADDLIEPSECVKLAALLDFLRRIRREEAGAGSQAGIGGSHPPYESDVQSENCAAPPSTAYSLKPTAYVVRCACDSGPSATGGDTIVDHIRLFPLLKGVRWTYKVHEQILPSLRRAGVPVQWTNIAVRHTGYVDRPLRNRKLERDNLPAWTRGSLGTSPGATWLPWPASVATTPRPNGCGRPCSPNARATKWRSATSGTSPSGRLGRGSRAGLERRARFCPRPAPRSTNCCWLSGRTRPSLRPRSG
jgi:Glycosyl transferase family 2